MNDARGFPIAFVQASDDIGRYEDTGLQADQICRLVGLKAGATVLDLPCGIGRFTREFHLRGHCTVGVDLSQDQIEFARLNNPGPKYMVGDMRSPPVRECDLLLNLYSSFGYFDTEEEDIELLHEWYRVIRPGGSLIMELSDLERAAHRLGTESRIVCREYDRSREFLFMEWNSRVLTTTYEIYDGDSFTCRARLYSKEDLANKLVTAGFAAVQLFGKFDGSAKTAADRAVLVATK